MESKTIQIDDTVAHIRFESKDGYGCEIPFDADFYYEHRASNDKPVVYWHESDDVSSLRTNPARKNTEKGGTEYSGGAIVTAEKTEIIHK